jgi:hypothetical protein
MTIPSLRILYIGPLRPGSTTLQRLQAMKDLNQDIVTVDDRPDYVAKIMQTLPYRIYRKLFGPVDLAGVNRAMIQFCRQTYFDFVWLDKGITIKPATLEIIKKLQPKCIIAGYSPDDMTGNKNNRSSNFLKCLPYYDIYFTTKTYCVEELKKLGCPQVEFIGNAYDMYTHKPIPISNDDRRRLGGPVGFIGQWEPQRANSLDYLAKSGIEVRVWGYTWERCTTRHKNLKLENKPVWGDDYARTICSFDINLCFLRKVNRDLQTTRSIEIPACGAFMLAERTDEHLALFEEGKEAAYFSSDEELVDKVKYYLAHEDQRKRIAAAGRQRCIKSGYSNRERLKTMMQKILALRK